MSQFRCYVRKSSAKMVKSFLFVISEECFLKLLNFPAEGNRITYRGCQLDGGKSDVCTIAMTKAKNVNVEIEDCKICMEDACNKSPTSHVNLWVVFVSLIIIKAFV